MYNIIYYETVNGKRPAEEFIYNQDKKMRAKILSNLDYIANEGINAREPRSKYLKDGIFEVRSQVGNNITRILYFFCLGQEIILTNGFVKKTQETPKAEIQKAKQFRDDYIRRKQNE